MEYVGARRKRRQRGRGPISSGLGGLGSILSAFGLAKRKKRQSGKGPVSGLLSLIGLKKRRPKRRVVRRRAMVGNGFFGNLWSGIKSGFKPIGSVLKDAGAFAAGHAVGAINPRLGRLTQRGITEFGNRLGFAKRKRARRSVLVPIPVPMGYPSRSGRVAGLRL